MIIDLCDNCLHENHKTNAHQINLINLKAISKYISYLVVSSGSLKEEIKNILGDEFKFLKIFVLPDPIETLNEVILTAKYHFRKTNPKKYKAKLNELEIELEKDLNSLKEELNTKKIKSDKKILLWFGNASSHNEYGCCKSITSCNGSEKIPK